MLLFGLLLLFAGRAPACPGAQTDPRPASANIVLVVLDDLGVEKIGAHRESPPAGDPPCTPNIDALAARGLLFRHAWANPVCSPTRAQLLGEGPAGSRYARPRELYVATYATTDTADEAIARARSMRAPWFLQVGFNAGHAPFEAPPAELVLAACARPSGRDEKRFEVLRTMVAALDTEIGRMLAEIRRVDPEAVIVLMGDNGTSIPGAEGESGGCFAPERSKGTLYEGGIRVPLIVAGPLVVPGECEALVSATDLFATFAELAHRPNSARDSVSLLPYLRGDKTPRRATVYAETFRPNCASPDAPGAAP